MDGSPLILILTGAGLVCLLVSLGLSWRYVRRREETRTKSAWMWNLCGLVMLTGSFVAAAAMHPHPPITTLSDSLLFFAMILLAVNNVTVGVTRSHVISLAVTPIVLIVGVVSLFADTWVISGDARNATGNAFVVVHVTLFALSYALFAVAAGFATLFLLQDSVLKTKNYTPLFFKLPGLVKLESYAGRAAMWGLALLTVAIGLAFTTLHRIGNSAVASRPDGMFADTTILAALLLWFYYVTFAILRLVLGWSGRRASYLSIAGLILLLLLYFVSKMMPATWLHGYTQTQAGLR